MMKITSTMRARTPTTSPVRILLIRVDSRGRLGAAAGGGGGGGGAEPLTEGGGGGLVLLVWGAACSDMAFSFRGPREGGGVGGGGGGGACAARMGCCLLSHGLFLPGTEGGCGVAPDPPVTTGCTARFGRDSRYLIEVYA